MTTISESVKKVVEDVQHVETELRLTPDQLPTAVRIVELAYSRDRDREQRPFETRLREARDDND